MAIYHLHVKNISRGQDRSAVAAAAYRSAERLWNADEESWSDFSRRTGIVHLEILAPAAAPLWVHHREQLWNRVEAAERRKDARLAKEIEVAVPQELAFDQRIALVRAFADKLTTRGLIVDVAVHDIGDGNPHAHLLFTTRKLKPDGFDKKIRELDKPAFVEWARKGWEDLANAALRQAGSAARVDRRSLKAQGIDRRPQKHRGLDRAERRQKRMRRPREPSQQDNRNTGRSPMSNDRPMTETEKRRAQDKDRAEIVAQHVAALESVQRELRGLTRDPEGPTDRKQQQRLTELYQRRNELFRQLDHADIKDMPGLDRESHEDMLVAYSSREYDALAYRQLEDERAEAREPASPERRGRSAETPARPNLASLPPEQRQYEIERRTRLDELHADIGDVQRQIAEARTRRFMSDEERAQALTPLMRREQELTKEHNRIALREPPARERTPPIEREAIKELNRDFAARQKQMDDWIDQDDRPRRGR